MCLSIRKEAKTQIVYKVYRFNMLTGEYTSPYQYTNYGKAEMTLGKVIQSNRKSVKLTVAEFDDRTVDRGLHVLTSLADALKEANSSTYSGYNAIVVAFEGSVRHLVASGEWQGSATPSAVYTQLTFLNNEAIFLRNAKYRAVARKLAKYVIVKY